jgi:predicted molibdopterin-dependent oxidoreductase YjgC
MCDVGRYNYKYLDASSRLTQPWVQQNGEFEVVSWTEAITRTIGRISEAKESGGANSIVVLASAQLTNEDLFLIRKFFDVDLGISQIDFRVPDRNPSEGDNFLLCADRNPNTRGAEAIIWEEQGFKFEQVLNSAVIRQLKLLYICEQDLVKKLGMERTQEFISRFEYVIYQGSNENETSGLADLILPAATYAEVDGTFTNFEGRVQKINAALEPLGESLPAWQIVCKLANAAGQHYDYESAEAVFAELTQTVTEFELLNYGKIGDQGSKISQPTPVQA